MQMEELHGAPEKVAHRDVRYAIVGHYADRGRASHSEPGGSSPYVGLLMGFRAWIVNSIAASALIHPSLRLRLLRSAGAKIGRARIMHGANIGGNISALTIGDGTFLNIGCSLHPSGGITIGNDV